MFRDTLLSLFVWLSLTMGLVAGLSPSEPPNAIARFGQSLSLGPDGYAYITRNVPPNNVGSFPVIDISMTYGGSIYSNTIHPIMASTDESNGIILLAQGLFSASNGQEYVWAGDGELDFDGFNQVNFFGNTLSAFIVGLGLDYITSSQPSGVVFAGPKLGDAEPNTAYFRALAPSDLPPNLVQNSITTVSGTNKCAGQFTLVNGLKTVSNTAVTNKAVIRLTVTTVSGTRAGDPDIVPTPGVGFQATGAVGDNSTYNYIIDYISP